MKRAFKPLLLIASFSICGCYSEKVSTSSSEAFIPSTSNYVQHDYEEISDKLLLWSNIFGIDKEAYYVYFFSKTCSHCGQIKEFMIEQALSRDDIYFVESSDEDVYIKDPKQTLGLTSIEGFGIVGYPSLVRIVSGIITLNVVGSPNVKSEIMN